MRMALALVPSGFFNDMDAARDPYYEQPRVCFGRFVVQICADFLGLPVPAMAPTRYASPAYDAVLAAWRSEDPAAVVEPLLAACDWHTHECMFSRSDRPSKQVDFIDDSYMGWPIDVLMVLRLRDAIGLANPPPPARPLMQMPLGACGPPWPAPRDLLFQVVARRAQQELAGTAAAGRAGQALGELSRSRWNDSRYRINGRQSRSIAATQFAAHSLRRDERMNHRKRGLSAAAAACGLLVGCGGANLSVDVTYQVNGQLVDPSSMANLVRGQPVMAMPRAVGLPAACQGKERIVAALRSAVPAGLSFDAATGAFSGTPTQRSLMRVELSLTVEGYTSSVRRTLDFAM